jgi:hypothetical protein
MLLLRAVNPYRPNKSTVHGHGVVHEDEPEQWAGITRLRLVGSRGAGSEALAGVEYCGRGVRGGVQR